MAAIIIYFIGALINTLVMLMFREAFNETRDLRSMFLWLTIGAALMSYFLWMVCIAVVLIDYYKNKDKNNEAK